MEFIDEQYSNQSYTLKDIKVLKSFFTFLKPYLKHFILLLILAVITTGCFALESRLSAALIGKIADQYLGNMSMEEVLKSFYLFLTVDTIIIVFGSISMFIVDYQLRKIGQYIIYDFRRSMFEHIS